MIHKMPKVEYSEEDMRLARAWDKKFFHSRFSDVSAVWVLTRRGTLPKFVNSERLDSELSSPRLEPRSKGKRTGVVKSAAKEVWGIVFGSPERSEPRASRVVATDVPFDQRVLTDFDVIESGDWERDGVFADLAKSFKGKKKEDLYRVAKAQYLFQKGEIDDQQLDERYKDVLGQSFDKSKVVFAYAANCLIDEFKVREGR